MSMNDGSICDRICEKVHYPAKYFFGEKRFFQKRNKCTAKFINIRPYTQKAPEI